MTLRYRSFRSLVAKRPPSSWTIGRRSGGSTGTASMIIHSGWLLLTRKASTTFRRFIAFWRFWPLELTDDLAQVLAASSSRSTCWL